MDRGAPWRRGVLSRVSGLGACIPSSVQNTAMMFTELYYVKDNYHLDKLARTLAKANLSILDKRSYLSFNRHQSELLFQVISY